MQRPTVIYNGACPVCAAGIRQARRQHGSDGVAWIDIGGAPDALADRGVTVDDVRLRLHAIDRNGGLRVGVGAFAIIWRQSPHWRSLGKLVDLPVIAPTLALLYDGIAHALYAWNRRMGRW